MRAFIDCSEPCKPKTLDDFRRRFGASQLQEHAVGVCYALAEYVFAVTQTRRGTDPRTVDLDGVAVLSCGVPIDGVRVRIVDERGADLADGRVGHIVIGGPSLFGGYHRVEQTAALVDGWYRTGDLGFLREGELFVTGRVDDLLIVHGKNLYAHDVEHAIVEVGIKPGRVVALGIFNEETGSQDLVVVAERDGDPTSDPDVSRAIVSAIFSSTGASVFDVRLVEPGWLVKTTSGKISRERNAQKYLASFRANPVSVE